jgi:outer membrane immunogenic protein
MRIQLASLLVAAASFNSVQAASAADLPVKAPRPAPVVASAWTGCYVGVNGGGAWGRTRWSDFVVGVDLGRDDTAGALAGGQVGCDYQTGAFVFGVEGMFDWTNLEGDHLDPVVGLVTLRTNSNWLATASARVGYALDRTLLYAKGGGAWINRRFDACAGGVCLMTDDHTRGGWMAGAGLEHLFWPNWSVKLEYNYLDFGTDAPAFCLAGACVGGTNLRQDVHVVLVGLNYRLGGPR